MEHLPCPDRPAYRIQIPYYGDSYFRHGCKHIPFVKLSCPACFLVRSDWEPYWQRLGFNHEAIRRGEFWRYPGREEKLRKYFFAWLYFGVIDRFFHKRVDLRKFKAKGKDGCDYLTTVNLNSELERLCGQLRATSDSYFDFWVRSTALLFACVDNFCRVSLDAYPQVKAKLPKDGLIAIHLLYDALYVARAKLMGVIDTKYEWGLATVELQQRLIEQNWCPRERLKAGYRISIAHYASLFSDRDNSLHLSCSEQHCSRNQIEIDTYCVRHATELSTQRTASCRNNNCGTALCNELRLVQIIQSGLVPLVTADARNNVQVQGYDLENSCYIAISHVWSDGCGNPGNNSLPKCQIRYLRIHMDYLGPDCNDSTPFFLDTLCVPVGNSVDAKAARKKLISIMSQIYEHARFVLVRDQELMGISKDRPAIEIAFRILFSQWFSRLWTLQEAVAAGKLQVCVIDGLVAIDEDILKSILNGSPPILRRHHVPGKGLPCLDLWDYIAATISQVLRLHGNTLSEEMRVRMTFDLAHTRRTSRVEDELMCVSSILRYSPKSLLELSSKADHERTAWLVKRLGKVPVSLVLFRAPRLKFPGLHWCPERMARCWDTRDETHEVRPEGLYGSWKTTHFTLPRGFVRRLMQQQSGQVQFQYRHLQQTPVHLFSPSFVVDRGSHTSVVALMFNSAEDLQILQGLEGQSLALLTPIRSYQANIPLTVQAGEMEEKAMVVEIDELHTSLGHKNIPLEFGRWRLCCSIIYSSEDLKLLKSSALGYLLSTDQRWTDTRYWIID